MGGRRVDIGSGVDTVEEKDWFDEAIEAVDEEEKAQT